MNTYGIACPGCGSHIQEDVSRPELECEFCGSRFTTPEHDARYQHHLEHSYLRDSVDEQRRYTDAVEKSSRRSIFRSLAAPIAVFFAGLLGRVSQFALGLVLIIIAIPMVMQYGFLRSLVQPSSPPDSISAETFEQRILGRLKDEAAKNILLKHYTRGIDSFEINEGLNFQEKRAVHQSLARSGYSISGLYSFFFTLPVLGGLYAGFAAGAGYLHNQILAALILGFGLALVKRRR